MRTCRIRLMPALAAGLALFVLSAAPSAAQGLNAERKGLWGKVTDPEGKPVVGLVVKLSDRPDMGGALEVKSTDRGFVFPRLAQDQPRDYYLRIESTEWYIRKFHIVVRRLGRGDITQDDEGELYPTIQDKLPAIRHRLGFSNIEIELAKIADFRAPAAAAQGQQRKEMGLDQELSDLVARGNFKGAADKLRETLAAAPGDGERRWQLAQVLAQAGETAEAIKEGQKAVAVKPDLKGARLKIAEWLNEMGRGDQAIGLLEQERDADPGNAVVHRGLAVLLREAGRTEDAEKAFAKWAELAPDDPEALLGLAGAKAARQDYAGAEELYRKAAEKDPENAYRLFYNVGAAIWNRKGDTEAAVAALTKSIELKGDFPKAHRLLGDCLLNQGKLAEARAHLEKFLELAPNDPEAADIKKLVAGLPKK